MINFNLSNLSQKFNNKTPKNLINPSNFNQDTQKILINWNNNKTTESLINLNDMEQYINRPCQDRHDVV